MLPKIKGRYNVKCSKTIKNLECRCMTFIKNSFTTIYNSNQCETKAINSKMWQTTALASIILTKKTTIQLKSAP